MIGEINFPKISPNFSQIFEGYKNIIGFKKLKMKKNILKIRNEALKSWFLKTKYSVRIAKTIEKVNPKFFNFLLSNCLRTVQLDGWMLIIIISQIFFILKLIFKKYARYN